MWHNLERNKETAETCAWNKKKYCSCCITLIRIDTILSKNIYDNFHNLLFKKLLTQSGDQTDIFWKLHIIARRHTLVTQNHGASVRLRHCVWNPSIMLWFHQQKYLYCCSENSDSQKHKWGDSDISAFNYGVFMTSVKDFKPKVNSNSLSVFTDCILVLKVEWLDKKHNELVIDTQSDSVPFMFKSYDCYMKTFWLLMLLEKWAKAVV